MLMIAITVLGFILFWFIIGIALCVWVYRDAQDRGMYGAVWLTVVLFTGPIGLIIYLIIRGEQRPYYRPPPPQRRTHFCTRCGHEVPVDARFCPQCGNPL